MLQIPGNLADEQMKAPGSILVLKRRKQIDLAQRHFKYSGDD
jgi:hypothetical protein